MAEKFLMPKLSPTMGSNSDLPMTFNEARRTLPTSSCRAFHRARTARTASSTMAMANPEVKSPAIDTPAVGPSTIRAMDGGSVSAIAESMIEMSASE